MSLKETYSCCVQCWHAEYNKQGDSEAKFQWLLRHTVFLTCTNCGNKRCPKAAYHGYKCTHSNLPDQIPELE